MAGGENWAYLGTAEDGIEINKTTRSKNTFSFLSIFDTYTNRGLRNDPCISDSDDM